MGVDCMLVCFLEIQDAECDGDAICVPPQLMDQVEMAQQKAKDKASKEAHLASREKASNEAKAAYDAKRAAKANGEPAPAMGDGTDAPA